MGFAEKMTVIGCEVIQSAVVCSVSVSCLVGILVFFSNILICS